MNGTILDHDTERGGVLRGADGRRYAFAAAEWKSATPPAPGMAVDFEPDGESARSLYALPAPAAPPAPPAEAAIAEPGGFLAGRPGLPLAALLLLACFLPFLTLGPLSANLFNLVGVASSAGPLMPRLNMEPGLWLFYGLYVVPLLALLLIIQEWRGRAGTWLRIGTGLVGLLAPVAITLGARAMFTTASAPTGLRALVRRGLRSLSEHVGLDMPQPHIGIGWIAIGLLSLALIAVGIALRPRAGPSPPRP